MGPAGLCYRHVSTWAHYVHWRWHVRVTIDWHLCRYFLRFDYRNDRSLRDRMALWHWSLSRWHQKHARSWRTSTLVLAICLEILHANHHRRKFIYCQVDWSIKTFTFFFPGYFDFHSGRLQNAYLRQLYLSHRSYHCRIFHCFIVCGYGSDCGGLQDFPTRRSHWRGKFNRVVIAAESGKLKTRWPNFCAFQRVRILLQPTSDWGPALQVHRIECGAPTHTDSQVPLTLPNYKCTLLLPDFNCYLLLS